MIQANTSTDRTDRADRLLAISQQDSALKAELLLLIQPLLPAAQAYVQIGLRGVPGCIKYLFPNGSFSWGGDAYEGHRPTDLRDLSTEQLIGVATDLAARQQAIEEAARPLTPAA